MSPENHKWLDVIQHLSFYISGAFIFMAAGFKLWWYDKKVVKKRIATLETLAENMASKDDLRECREGVDKQDADNLKVVLTEIQAIRRENSDNIETNSQQHLDIMHQMTRLHSE